MDWALRLLHPFMPFITEEIWQKMPHQGESLMIQEFPKVREARANPEAAQDMEALMDLIVAIRSSRAELNIEPKRVLDARLVVPDAHVRTLVAENIDKVQYLARLGKIEFVDQLGSDVLKGIWRLGEFGLDISGVVDYQAERDRIQKELARITADIDKILKKINSQEFLARAPESVVSENQARHAELLERFRKLSANLSQLPQK
jgi:valyl-tRNA synthetase